MILFIEKAQKISIKTVCIFDYFLYNFNDTFSLFMIPIINREVKLIHNQAQFKKYIADKSELS